MDRNGTKDQRNDNEKNTDRSDRESLLPDCAASPTNHLLSHHVAPSMPLPQSP